MCDLIENNKKVLVLYVGGTIGMKKVANGAYAPVPNLFQSKIKTIPELHNQDAKLPDDEFILSSNNSTVWYKMIEYSPLLDSSNMSPKDWIQIAADVGKHYANYDGFVVIQGTDTMAFTASALSFLLEGLQKSVILTGSQVPIFEPRSDAKDNLLSSLLFAAFSRIPEVAVFFDDKLIRGNRTSKLDCSHFDAFFSPNYPPLAVADICPTGDMTVEAAYTKLCYILGIKGLTRQQQTELFIANLRGEITVLDNNNNCFNCA